MLLPPSEVLKESQEKFYIILDEIRLVCVGMNMLDDYNADKRWGLVRLEYYERLKEVLMYELRYLEFNNEKTLQ